MAKAGVTVKARKETHLKELRFISTSSTTSKQEAQLGKKPDSLNVLEQVAPSNRRQSLLSLNRAGDVVVRNINVGRDIGRVERLDTELGLALVLLCDRNRVGGRLSVHGSKGGVGHVGGV